MNFIKNLKLRYKFLLVMGAIAIPLTLLSTLVLNAGKEGIEFAEKEAVGVEYIVPAQKILKTVAEHRALVAGQEFSTLGLKQQEVSAAISALDSVDEKYQGLLSIHDEWLDLKAQWQRVASVSRTSDTHASVNEHNHLINNVAAFVEHIGDASNPILDPNLESYYLMDAIVITLPAAQREIETLRTMLLLQQQHGGFTAEQYLKKKVSLEKIQSGLVNSQRSLDIVVTENATLKAALEPNLQRFVRETGAYTDYVSQLSINASAADIEQALGLAGQALVAWDDLSDQVANELLSVLDQRASHLTTELLLEMGMVLICVLASLGCALWVIRSITAPMSTALMVFNRIETGDLSTPIDVNSRDETGQLLQGLKDMQSTLGILDDVTNMLGGMAAGDMSGRIHGQYQGKFDQLKIYSNQLAEKFSEIVGNIQASATAVKTAADEIAEGNNDLSRRTEEQAASLEQTAASMEEITSTIQQNTENARQANELAGSARDSAAAGGKIVDTAIAAMQEINSSSHKIADIISVIDDIAFQTNLLALNASVEAARAGEQGRGFAVVAGEVRNLAGRSAKSAKEIKELIEDSVVKVDDGSRLVNESGEKLQEIVASVKKVSDIVAEITAASEEQSIGIAEINSSVTQMDAMTQQNAAMVEEVAAASEAMGSEANDLDNQMRFFKVGDHASVANSGSSLMTTRPERRSGNRPWSRPQNEEVESFTETPALKAVNSVDDWEEF